MEYGLFDETPSIMFLDNRNFYVSTGAMLGKTTALSNFGYEQETKSSYIRLNDVVDYEADSKKSFIDLYVDDLFPAQLFYGNGILEEIARKYYQLWVTEFWFLKQYQV